jgi:hypothetical protein
MNVHGDHARPRRRRPVGLLAAAGLGLALLGVGAPAAGAYGTYELTGLGGGLVRADGTTPADQAGEHPEALKLDFGIPDNIQDAPSPLPSPLPTRREWLFPRATTEHVRVDLPVGLAANPAAFPTCTDEQLENFDGTDWGPSEAPPEEQCPVDSQVGFVKLKVRGELMLDMGWSTFETQLPVYNMTREPGQAARFAFNPGSAPASVVVLADFTPVEVIGEIRPGDQGVSFSMNAPPSLPLLGAKMTLWGTPGLPTHDADRRKTDVTIGTDSGSIGTPEAPFPLGAYYDQPTAAEDRSTAFLSNPTSCDGPLTARVTVRSVDGQTATGETRISDGMTGCADVPFAPTVSFGDAPVAADANVPLKVSVQVPQDQAGDRRASAHLREAKVTLPEGFSISPSAATGLEACGDAQLAAGTSDAVACPAASKVGKVSIASPLVDGPLTGDIFVGQPQPGNRYRLFLAAEGHGVSIRLKGDVHADPTTGRLTTTFKDNPQLPFTDLDLAFDGGDRGIIASPQTCGTKAGAASLTSFASDVPVNVDASIDVVGCNGFPFDLGFGLGLTPSDSGAFSSLGVRFARPDGHQFLSGISAELPQGMTARLKGVERCAEAQIAAESCPSGSRIGTVTVHAGPGGSPFAVAAPMYLTNAYNGGSFGMVAIVPVVAGPYDLGKIVVRQSLRIDPETAQVSVVSDPLPQIKEGVVLRVRSVAIDIDRPGFVRNPTSCGASYLGATVTSPGGATARPSGKLDLQKCEQQAFAPKLKLELKNKTQMGKFKHPRLTATVTQKTGEAGLGVARVALPKSLALAADNARGLCETADALKDACPKESIVGSASAETPVLDRTLKGAVYFVKGERQDPKTGRIIKTLPTLYVALRGETAINLRADTAVSKDGRLVTTFPNVPDQPITKFTLNINGGKHGIISATRALCGVKHRGTARFVGQNGAKPAAGKPVISAACKAAKAGKR